MLLITSIALIGFKCNLNEWAIQCLMDDENMEIICSQYNNITYIICDTRINEINNYYKKTG